MRLYVAKSKSRVALALKEDHFYVLHRRLIVYKDKNGVFAIEDKELNIEGGKNIVDAFLCRFASLKYASVTELNMEEITLLRKRVK